MESLSDHQVDQINDLLVQQGVGYQALRNDLLDHICCAVEIGMAQNRSFPDCLNETLNQFGLENFKLIQESTLYLLNQKLNRMKKVSAIIGMLASLMVIVGMIFRVNHVMGASILLVTGLSTIALVVLPMLGYLNFMAKEDRSTLISSAVGYAAAMFIAIGGLFKLMHWPWAMLLFWYGVAILLFGFIPLFTIRSYRLAENKLFALSKSMLIVAGMVLIWGLSSNTRIFKLEIPGGSMKQEVVQDK